MSPADGPAWESPAVPEAAPSTFPRWRWGWIFSAVWLLFLLEPFEAALAARDRPWGVVAIATLLAFAALYVVLLLRWQRGRGDGAVGAVPGEAVTGTLLLAVLAALTLPGTGTSGANTLVFVCAYGMFALPPRPAVAIVLGVSGGLFGASRAVAGWDDLAGTAAGAVLASLAVFGVSRMLSRGRELALAQQDLARLAVAEERTRFARDLHDILGHSLTVITLKAELAGRLLEVDPVRTGHEIADVERLARDALSDVRAALEGYREVSLGTELAGARQALAAAGIEAHLPGAVDGVHPDHRELFGWAVREGVTNVVRHSGATRCWIELTPSALTVCDDGSGPHPGRGGGAGLGGLADRARDAGGVLTVGRAAQGGFRLEVAL